MKAKHDIHIHNFLSDCCLDNQASPMRYIELAKEEGLELMGFSNHTWDESIPMPGPSAFYHRDCVTFQLQIKPQIPEHVEGIKVLVGAETEYCGMYDILGMGKEAALKFDYLLIPHTHVQFRDFVMPATEDERRARAHVKKLFSEIPGITPERAEQMAISLPNAELEPFMGEKKVDYIKFVSDFMVDSFRSLMNNELLKTYSDLMPISVAHPFQPVGSYALRPQMLDLISNNTFGELFEMAKKRGIGLEINACTGIPQTLRMFSVAKEVGCKFTFGSDLHAGKNFPWIRRTQKAIDYLGLTEDDLMDFVRT